jgi:hypothetical protein
MEVDPMVERGRRSADSDRLRHEVVTQWHATRVLFLEAPERALQLADELVREALRRAGYPVGGPTPPPYDDMVYAYVSGHAVARANARGRAEPAELRGAMADYGTLIADLAAEPVAEAPLSRDPDGRWTSRAAGKPAWVRPGRDDEDPLSA